MKVDLSRWENSIDLEYFIIGLVGEYVYGSKKDKYQEAGENFMLTKSIIHAQATISISRRTLVSGIFLWEVIIGNVIEKWRRSSSWFMLVVVLKYMFTK